MWRSAWFSKMSAEGDVIGQEGFGWVHSWSGTELGTRSVRVIFIALLVVLVVLRLFIPTAQLLQNFPLVALPAPAAVRVLLLPVTCNKIGGPYFGFATLLL